MRALLEQYLGGGVHLALWSYVALALVTLVGAFLGAYLKKRGEEFATKQDFQEILYRVKKTTEATEEIKAAISEEQRTKAWEREDRTRFHNERRKLYATLLGSTGLAISRFSEALYWSKFRDESSTEKSREGGHKEWLACLSEADVALGEARAAYLEVMIVGSRPVLEKATELLQALNDCAKVELQLLDEAVDQPTIERLRALREAFLNLARAELGIGDP
jgi:hypothetical protein